MSRIRSVHPGLWTDENFVELSMQARLFLIGLWGEADDYGVFEWKPLRLKMRLAPVDDIDAAALLSEITRHGQIVHLIRADKHYGIIKNFRKFQRPKNPSAPLIPLDQEINAIVGLPPGDIPPPALPQDEPSPTETAPQMEDGVGKVEEVGVVDARAQMRAVGERVMTIMKVRDDPRWFGDCSLVEVWLKRDFDPELDIYPTVEKLMAQRSQGPPSSLKYFDRAIAQAHADRNRSIPEPSNVNRSSPQRPAKPSLDDQYAELDRLCGDIPGPLESFGDPAGRDVIDNPPQRH